MPIYEMTRRHGVFAPEEVAMLGKVFDDLLQTLGLVDRKDPMTEIVAKKLIDLANTGIREPDRLKALTLQAFAPRA
jgi:hypothetical protein